MTLATTLGALAGQIEWSNTITLGTAVIGLIMAAVGTLAWGVVRVLKETATANKEKAERLEIDNKSMFERLVKLEALPNLEEHARLLGAVSGSVATVAKLVDDHDRASSARDDELTGMIAGALEATRSLVEQQTTSLAGHDERQTELHSQLLTELRAVGKTLQGVEKRLEKQGEALTTAIEGNGHDKEDNNDPT